MIKHEWTVPQELLDHACGTSELRDLMCSKIAHQIFSCGSLASEKCGLGDIIQENPDLVDVSDLSSAKTLAEYGPPKSTKAGS